MTQSDNLLVKSDLTLTEAVRISRQAKARKQKCSVVRGDESPSDVDDVSQPCYTSGLCGIVRLKYKAAADALFSAPVVIPEQANGLFAEEVEEFTTQSRASLSGTAMRPQPIQEEKVG